jgi:uncharacterized protein YbaR (Trm112 family)
MSDGGRGLGDGGDDDGSDARPPRAYDRRMLEALVCPVTHAPLQFDSTRMELISKAAHLAYPIRGGIPIMLESEARALD